MGVALIGMKVRRKNTTAVALAAGLVTAVVDAIALIKISAVTLPTLRRVQMTPDHAAAALSQGRLDSEVACK